MKLTYRCQHCKEKNTLKSNAWTRSELHQQHGDIVKDKCSYCPNLNKLELTEIRAVPNEALLKLGWLIPTIGVLVGVLVTGVLWQVYYFTPRVVAGLIVLFLALPMTVGQVISRSEETKVSTFNKSR